MAEQDMSRNEAEGGSRALVVTDSRASAAPRGTAAAPADAAFLTQLMACAQALPAYRRHRRAEPGLAAARYRAALALA